MHGAFRLCCMSAGFPKKQGKICTKNCGNEQQKTTMEWFEGSVPLLISAPMKQK